MYTTKVLNAVRRLKQKLAVALPEVVTDHDRTGHWYLYEGQRYESVSAITSTIKDESLMDYKMNRAIDVYEDAIVKTLKSGNIEHLADLKEQAKNAGKLAMMTAGDVGSAVHLGRELYFEEWIKTGQRPDYPVQKVQSRLKAPFDTDLRVTAGLRAIERFLNNTRAVPVAVEVRLANHKLKLGGTLDDLMIIPKLEKIPTEDPEIFTFKETPELWLIDLKTSNIGRKSAYVAQVGLYYHMLYQMTKIRPKHVGILHVEKLDGTYELIRLRDMKAIVKAAIQVHKTATVAVPILEEQKARNRIKI